MRPDAKTGPVRVALTGGIGSGKSTALTMFTARGAAVIDTDKVVHDLLERDDLRHRVAHELCIDDLPPGEESRGRLAEIVFRDDERLEKLEQILFPLVREEIEAWMKRGAAARAALAVVEVPMLFEAGMEDMFDYVVLVTAPDEVRRLRHEGRVGRADFERRASRQLPEAEKRKRSDFVFDNTGPPDALDDFVERTRVAITGSGNK